MRDPCTQTIDLYDLMQADQDLSDLWSIRDKKKKMFEAHLLGG